MSYPPDITVVARPWLARPRAELVAYGVPATPRIIEIHATRSGVRWDGWPQSSLEFQATCNWVQSDGNKQTNAWLQSWGGCAHAVISERGQLASFWDKAIYYTTYAAGFGGLGWPQEWAVDWVGISYELCQPLGDMPFTDACLERAALEVAKDCVTYGIAPVRIPYLVQTGDMNVVSGLVGHEDTANGHKVGKTDPGPMFPWDEFIAEVRHQMEGEASMPTQEEINEWKNFTEGLLAELRAVHAVEDALTPILRRKDLLQASWRRGPWYPPLDLAAYRKGLPQLCDALILAAQKLKERGNP